MGEPNGSEYSPFVAFIYIFNLVVGTGVLALPSVLIMGGWLLGGIFLVLVSFLSYVTVTFMLESMAFANALLRLQGRGENGFVGKSAVSENSALLSEDGALHDESPPLPSLSENQLFQITKRTELGEMAGLFFNQWGIILFYSALILYLYGDSVIYSTVVARSLVAFFFGSTPKPWAFDLCLTIFLFVSLPFCFFDFQKTKVLQIITVAIRNISLNTMIILAILAVAKKGPHDEDVPRFNISALPNLFGGAVYSFMCHHSLPSIITPMRDKAHVMHITAMAFVSVLVVYMLLFISSGLAFGTGIMDPITFNFPPAKYGFVGDALILFPVFTLSSNFPMLSITLRNNLGIMCQLMSQKATHGSMEVESTLVIAKKAQHEDWRWQSLLTLLAVLPPTLFSYFAEHSNISVDELVGLTGAFAGCAVMFIIPAALVYCSRKVFAEAYMLAQNHKGTVPSNFHASPFWGQGWVYTIWAWAGVALLFNGLKKFSNLFPM